MTGGTRMDGGSTGMNSGTHATGGGTGRTGSARANEGGAEMNSGTCTSGGPHMNGGTDTTGANRRAQLLLFAAIFLAMLAFGMTLPLFPFLLDSFGGSGVHMGLLVAVYGALQLTFAPVWGRASDRVGRKPLLLVGTAGVAGALLVFGLARNLAMLYAGQAVLGSLTSALFPVAAAYMSDISTGEKRAGAIGKIGAATGLGVVLGPGIGGLLAFDSLSLPFLLGALWAGLVLLLMLVFLPESPRRAAETPSRVAESAGPGAEGASRGGQAPGRPVDGRAWVHRSPAQAAEIPSAGPESAGGEARAPGRAPGRAADRRGRGGGGLLSALRAIRGPAGMGLFLAFAVYFGKSNFSGIFGLYAMERFGYETAEVGSLLMMMGLVYALAQGVLVGPATERLGENRVIRICLAGSVVGFVLLLVAGSYVFLAVAICILIGSNAGLKPATLAHITRQSSGEHGTAMGYADVFMSLGRVAGPLWAGLVFDLSIGLPFVSGAAFFALVLVVTAVGMGKSRVGGTRGKEAAAGDDAGAAGAA